VHDGRTFHRLHRAVCPGRNLGGGCGSAGAGRAGHEGRPPVGGEEIHRQAVEERWIAGDDRKPQSLHIEKPVGRLGAQIAVQLAVGRENVSRFEARAWVRPADTARDNHVRSVRAQKPRQREGRIHRSHAGVEQDERTAGDDGREPLALERSREARYDGRHEATLAGRPLGVEVDSNGARRLPDVASARRATCGPARLPARSIG